MPAPLIVSYRTKSGRDYIYDCATGTIMEVDEVIAAIVGDYRFHNEEEILEKHVRLGRERVKAALRELDDLPKKGYLTDHQPTELNRTDTVYTDKRLVPLAEFWQHSSMLLILGITERCNLDCSYCCYSGKFPGQRSHGNRSMSMDIATKAMEKFLSDPHAGDGTYPISFYGGEPLLEFHLLQECVRYAETFAASLGKRIQFNITTNGTLLDDEATDFLVAHGFSILVSLDGPRPSHDRYRVFPDRTGSFDLVTNHLKRFVERHPQWMRRGLNLTLTPPFEPTETAMFLEEWLPYFPMTRVSLVNPGVENRFDEISATKYGCSNAPCDRENVDPDNEAFRRFAESDAATLRSLWNSCVDDIARYGAVETWRKTPLPVLLFGGQLEMIHNRPVTKKPSGWTFFVPCVPGFTRRYCDVDGNYRVCERVDASETYRLGDVWNGLDPAKLEHVMEMRRRFGDCGNCTALKTCDICYARIPHSDAASNGFDPMFDMRCHQTRRSRETLLRTYTEIMEANPSAFERPALPETSHAGSPTLRFAAPVCRIDESIRRILTLETSPFI